MLPLLTLRTFSVRRRDIISAAADAHTRVRFAGAGAACVGVILCLRDGG